MLYGTSFIAPTSGPSGHLRDRASQCRSMGMLGYAWGFYQGYASTKAASTDLAGQNFIGVGLVTVSQTEGLLQQLHIIPVCLKDHIAQIDTNLAAVVSKSSMYTLPKIG